MNTALFTFAFLIVVGLVIYAGFLMFKLRTQKKLRQQKTQQRIVKISVSIQTIAKALEQQQCNLSEGCIRLFHLLESLPITEKPDFSRQFKGLYSLYEQVKDFPTHDVRNSQGKIETKKQDLQREELEAQLEPQILRDVSVLKSFVVQSFLD